MKIQDGYTKTTRMIEVRSMTLAEVKALSYGQTVEVIANDGKLRRVKINGNAKTWKRDADRVEVPVKYGMYEYARFDTADALRRFVVRVPVDVERDCMRCEETFIDAGDNEYCPACRHNMNRMDMR